VYNVAMPLLRKCNPDDPPFKVIEVAVNPSAAATQLATQPPVQHLGGAL
jgi:hypothetical protein